VRRETNLLPTAATVGLRPLQDRVEDRSLARDRAGKPVPVVDPGLVEAEPGTGSKRPRSPGDQISRINLTFDTDETGADPQKC